MLCIAVTQDVVENADSCFNIPYSNAEIALWLMALTMTGSTRLRLLPMIWLCGMLVNFCLNLLNCCTLTS